MLPRVCVGGGGGHTKADTSLLCPGGARAYPLGPKVSASPSDRASFERGMEGVGGLGAKSVCTKNGPTGFSQP